MRFVFDPDKDAANRKKHGVSLEEASGIDWESALVWSDTRRAYGEPRQCALGTIGLRVYYIAFVDRADQRRIISLRKANSREVDFYVKV